MFDRYRIVDQRDIQEAGRLAEDYLRSQETDKNTAEGTEDTVTKGVTKTGEEMDDADRLSPTS